MTETARRRVRPGPRADGRWTRSAAARIAVIYLASRVVTTVFLLFSAWLSPEGSRFGRGASLDTYALAWDAQWYQRIVIEGYPTQLPVTDAAEVAHNAWAFMPLFPWVSAALGSMLGSWGAGAVAIAATSGYLCCLVLGRILRDSIGESASLWAVAFFASGPLAAMFQVGYPETLFLLLIMLGILCLQRRRYGWLYVLIPAMAYLRPGVLAFALLIGMFGIRRWMTRDREPLRRNEPAHILALGAVATVLGFSWQVIAAIVTGRADAYLATELSWRRLWMGDEGEFVPFEGWVQGADYWFRQWGLEPAWAVPTVVTAVAAVTAILLFEPHVRRLGVEVRLWSASYVLYLLAVFLPQSSVFRLLLPLTPLAGALAQPRSTVWRAGILAACLAGQWCWIWNVYGLGTEFWHIP